MFRFLTCLIMIMTFFISAPNAFANKRRVYVNELCYAMGWDSTEYVCTPYSERARILQEDMQNELEEYGVDSLTELCKEWGRVEPNIFGVKNSFKPTDEPLKKGNRRAYLKLPALKRVLGDEWGQINSSFSPFVAQKSF